MVSTGTDPDCKQRAFCVVCKEQGFSVLHVQHIWDISPVASIVDVLHRRLLFLVFFSW